MERPVRLHIGAGDKYWPGFLNCDINGDQDINCTAHEWAKMLEFGAVDEIHSIHAFEHFPSLDIPSILDGWHSILKAGGKLIMEMPSMDKIARMIVNGETDERLTILGIFGDARDRKPGMMHLWCYTNAHLEKILTAAGFHEIKFMEPAYHIAQRDLRVECRRK